MIPNEPDSVAVITDNEGLQDFVARIRRDAWVAVDTEFMRERTYYPKLCLIQLATASELACVDPLAIADLSPLTALWADETVTKVFHAASQDLEVLLQDSGEIPRPVFDTQIAATLLGYPDQVGYARLVAEQLEVSLDKSHTRADWSKRPLSDQELGYAADDVRYLARLYPALDADLRRRGRRDWLDAEFRGLVEPARYRPDPDAAWRRVRGGQRLRPAQRRVLAQLAAWREREAMAADRPRGWILKDDALLALAQKRPRDRAGLERVRGLPDALKKRHGERLLELIARAPDQPAPAGLEEPPQTPLPADRQPLVDLLMAGLRERAAVEDIAVAALASRKELERLVGGERDLPVLSGWRRQAAGQALLDLLEGRRALRAGGDTLHWEPPVTP